MFSPWWWLGIAASAALLVCTPFMWRNRGAVFGLRWASVALLPAGLAITGWFTLFARVGKAVFVFFTRTAFAPTVWIGYALLAAAVVGWIAAGALASRGRGGTAARSSRGVGQTAGRGLAGSHKSVGNVSSPAAAQTASGADDEFAEAEAILRRHGI